jgi:hypothetical protein
MFSIVYVDWVTFFTLNFISAVRTNFRVLPSFSTAAEEETVSAEIAFSDAISS